MQTLKANYQKNIEILKENFNRGMTESQAIGVVNNFERQFQAANLYGAEEQEFIRQMRQLIADRLEDRTAIKVVVA